MRLTAFTFASFCALAAVVPALADDQPIAVTLQNDTFAPAEIKVPAGKPLTLQFTNKEVAPAEIESKELKIEKVVPAGGSIVARVRPLKPGRYLVVNEYREDVAKGYIVAE